jgi:hypothetical protein
MGWPFLFRDQRLMGGRPMSLHAGRPPISTQHARCGVS